MGMRLKGGQDPGRNDPCVCGSGLKFKKCHGDVSKVEICNRVANEKMAQLIYEEKRKLLIRLQQKDCEVCHGSGKDTLGEKCLDCQYITDEERIAEEYKRLSKGDEDEKSKV